MPCCTDNIDFTALNINGFPVSVTKLGDTTGNVVRLHVWMEDEGVSVDADVGGGFPVPFGFISCIFIRMIGEWRRVDAGASVTSDRLTRGVDLIELSMFS